MTIDKTVDGVTYREVSVEAFKRGLFRLAGEDIKKAEELFEEFKEAYIEEVIRTANAEKEGKPPAQLVLERVGVRERRRHLRKLNSNMKKAGMRRPPNTAAHHIASWHDIEAEQAREILRQYGIDTDDACNGVYMPRNTNFVPHPDMPAAYAHSKIHTDVYYVNLTFLLEEMAKRSETTKANMVALLQTIAKQLTEGTFPIHTRLDGQG
ncbi:MAG: AHH domain-containing protein [Gammaproteobacteria bacterium]|nr:AHH domain-containing protein [Gammaproteobacteria bacterium]